MATGLGEAVDVPAALPPALAETRADRGSAEFADWVDFASAGSDASGEFRCADCGYGAVVQQVLPSCPMCQGTVWERREPLAARLPI